jgi:predicted GNAT family acetyltransferase
MERVIVQTVNEGVVESLKGINDRLVREAIKEWDRQGVSGVYFCDYVNGYVTQKFCEITHGN